MATDVAEANRGCWPPGPACSFVSGRRSKRIGLGKPLLPAIAGLKTFACGSADVSRLTDPHQPRQDPLHPDVTQFDLREWARHAQWRGCV